MCLLRQISDNSYDLDLYESQRIAVRVGTQELGCILTSYILAVATPRVVRPCYAVSNGCDHERSNAMTFYSNYQPECMPELTAAWLASIRDVNGVPASRLPSIIAAAEREYDAYAGKNATEEGREEARYHYLRFAGLSEDFAEMYRGGIDG
jgi:hypothetical protein